MAVSFVGLNAAAASSASLVPSGAVVNPGTSIYPSLTDPRLPLPGDLLIVFAFRDGNVTPPSLPAGWTDLGSSGANLNSARVGSRVMQAGDTTTGTWTNATDVEVIVLRGADSVTFDYWLEGTGTVVSYPDHAPVTYPGAAVFVSNSSPASAPFWALNMAAHRSATNLNAATAAGMVTRSGPIGTLSAHTATDVTLFPQVALSAVNASSGWRSASLTVLAAATVTPVAEVLLQAGQFPPTHLNHIVSVRARKTSAANAGLTVALYNGMVQIATRSTDLTQAFADYEYTLTVPETQSITSYASLSLRLQGYSATGELSTVEVADASMNLPVAPSSPGANVFGAAIRNSTASVAASGVVGFLPRATGEVRISLAGGATPPPGRPHRLFVRGRKTSAAHTGYLVLGLYNGGVPIVTGLTTGELTTFLANYELPLSSAQAAAIGSYANLEMRLRGQSTSTPTAFEVAQLGLEVLSGVQSVTGAAIRSQAVSITARAALTDSSAAIIVAHPSVSIHTRHLVKAAAARSQTASRTVAAKKYSRAAVVRAQSATITAQGVVTDRGAVVRNSTTSRIVSGRVDHLAVATLSLAVFQSASLFEFNPLVRRPTGDADSGDWSSGPLWSKLRDESDATYITATAFEL